MFPEVTPLPNMEQRWVRIRLAGDEDYDNFDKRRQNDWDVRPLDTIPANERPTSTGKVPPEIGNAFYVRGHVLMHKRKEWVDEERADLARFTDESADAAIRQFRDETPADAKREGDELVEHATTG